MSTTFDPYASSRETTEGTVYSVTGGGWDELVSEIGEAKESELIECDSPWIEEDDFNIKDDEEHCCKEVLNWKASTFESLW